MRKPTGLISRFLSHERGNVAMIFAAGVVPAVLLAGMAVDFGRATQARTKLQAAVDAAVMTAVRVNPTTGKDPKAAAKLAFDTAWGATAMTSDVKLEEFQISPNNGAVTIKATGSIPKLLSVLTTNSNIYFSVTSQASVGSGKQIEVAMMIDLTGSMGDRRSGQTKIDGLKVASADLLDILFPKGKDTSNVRVSVVPFADFVNAGDYAPAATGLPAGGGNYTPKTDLAGTKSGTFGGTYSGATGNSPGSQFGVTPGTTTYPGQTSPAGSPYVNDYCSGNTQPPIDSSYLLRNGLPMGPVMRLQDGVQPASIPPGLRVATDSDPAVLTGNLYKGIYDVGYLMKDSDFLYLYSRTPDTGYYFASGGSNPPQWPSADRAPYDYMTKKTPLIYAPMIANPQGLTPRMYTGTNKRVSHTAPVGVLVADDPSIVVPAPAVSASSNGYGGFWSYKLWNTDASEVYEWYTSGYYIPVYTSLPGQNAAAAAAASCSTGQATGKLITCVTDRTGSQQFTGNGPAAGPVGPYNQGWSGSNYSSDGKCWAAGRELPKVIPLTNDTSTLKNFFDTATIGGSTPGHLGTAWAWYTLSPDWNSVWPTESQAGPYNGESVRKVAILMTDGEYNTEFSPIPSAVQAQVLCQAMKEKGIEVYTVGFGFSPWSQPGEYSAEGQAKSLLTQCSSGDNHYYFPYDSDALRRAFQNIGDMIMSVQTTQASRLLQ